MEGGSSVHGTRFFSSVHHGGRELDESGHEDLLKGLLQVEVVCRGASSGCRYPVEVTAGGTRLQVVVDFRES